jgi:hypothetical protein
MSQPTVGKPKQQWPLDSSSDSEAASSSSGRDGVEARDVGPWQHAASHLPTSSLKPSTTLKHAQLAALTCSDDESNDGDADKHGRINSSAAFTFQPRPSGANYKATPRLACKLAASDSEDGCEDQATAVMQQTSVHVQVGHHHTQTSSKQFAGWRLSDSGSEWEQVRLQQQQSSLQQGTGAGAVLKGGHTSAPGIPKAVTGSKQAHAAGQHDTAVTGHSSPSSTHSHLATSQPPVPRTPSAMQTASVHKR